MKKLIKKIAKALMKADSGERSCPDYKELARIAVKTMAKRMKKKAHG